MKLLVDMNLSPLWIDFFEKNGWQALHWSRIGSPKAKDSEIMVYALENDFIVFTHDLDFGTLLAVTQAKGPSVLQIRTQTVLPTNIGGLVLQALNQFQPHLESYALVTVDSHSARARVLPIRR